MLPAGSVDRQFSPLLMRRGEKTQIAPACRLRPHAVCRLVALSACRKTLQKKLREHRGPEFQGPHTHCTIVPAESRCGWVIAGFLVLSRQPESCDELRQPRSCSDMDCIDGRVTDLYPTVASRGNGATSQSL